jgi:hypothetical protein
MEMIEYSKRTPGVRYSDEEDVLLNTPVGAAGPAGCGPCGATCHTCMGFDLDNIRWSDHGRASTCRKRKQLVDGRTRGKTLLVPASMPACPSY